MHNLERGIALFNQRQFFAAHEELEDAWRESSGDDRLFLQALTQAAVALHHYSTGNLAGARSVLARSLRNMESYHGVRLGVRMDLLRADLFDCLSAIEADGRITVWPRITRM